MATDGAVLLPIISTTGETGSSGAVSLPLLIANENLGNVVLPLLAISGATQNISGGVRLPLVVVSGDSVGGAVANAAVVLPSLRAAARGGRDGYAGLTLPILEVSGTGGVTAVITGAAVLPLLDIIGAVYNPPSANTPDTDVGSAYQAWTVNIDNKAHTQYDNYLFNSFGSFNGSNYACGSDGIYQLTGDEDVSTAISTSLIWAISEYGIPRTKWVDAAYVHLRSSDGALEVWATVDERTRRIFTINTDQSPEGMHTRRALFNRGLIGTWWSVGIKKDVTTPLTISDIELRVIGRQRRVL